MGWDSDGIHDLCAAGRAHCISKVPPAQLLFFWMILARTHIHDIQSYGTLNFSLKSSDIAIKMTRPSTRLGLKVAPVAGSLLVWQTIGGDGQVILISNNCWRRDIGKYRYLVPRKNIVVAVS